MSTFDDAISSAFAAEVDFLAPETTVSPTVSDSEIGSDLSWTDDVDPAFRLVTDTQLVGEAIYRRLITLRGMLIDDPDYGLDVRAMISKGFTPTQKAAIAGRIKQEVEKDERIQPGAIVTLDDSTPDVWRIAIRAVTSAGPFTLTLNVTDAATKLGSLEGGA